MGGEDWQQPTGSLLNGPTPARVPPVEKQVLAGLRLRERAVERGICSRNDAVRNVPVILPALGVRNRLRVPTSGAGFMAVLAVSRTFTVLRQARHELREARTQ